MSDKDNNENNQYIEYDSKINTKKSSPRIRKEPKKAKKKKEKKNQEIKEYSLLKNNKNYGEDNMSNQELISRNAYQEDPPIEENLSPNVSQNDFSTNKDDNFYSSSKRKHKKKDEDDKNDRDRDRDKKEPKSKKKRRDRKKSKKKNSEENSENFNENNEKKNKRKRKKSSKLNKVKDINSEKNNNEIFDSNNFLKFWEIKEKDEEKKNIDKDYKESFEKNKKEEEKLNQASKLRNILTNNKSSNNSILNKKNQSFKGINIFNQALSKIKNNDNPVKGYDPLKSPPNLVIAKIHGVSLKSNSLRKQQWFEILRTKIKQKRKKI